LTLAILAWNASFLPAEEQQAMIDNVIDGALPAATEELKNGLKQIVHMLMARNRAYFSAYSRNIIDYELTAMGKGYRLFVASTLEEVGPQG
jgi:thermostable 8-oxoguanine DNA glycosylase